MRPILKSFLAMLGISAVLIVAYTAWTVQGGTPLSEIMRFLIHTSAGTLTIAGLIILFLIGWAMLSWNFRLFAEQKEVQREAEKRRAEEKTEEEQEYKENED